jgi:hypothetical protein
MLRLKNEKAKQETNKNKNKDKKAIGNICSDKYQCDKCQCAREAGGRGGHEFKRSRKRNIISC